MIEYNEMGVVELTQRIMQDLKSDSVLNNIAVRGEVSNFKYSGPHAYFSLKEADCLVNCVMFNAVYKLHKRKIDDGMVIKAYGSIRVYTKRGAYQLYTESIEEGKDLGELYRQFEALKKKLMMEGIFDKQKKEIPVFPKKIAVVASRTSAAFQDVLNTVRKRYPMVEILLFHTGVQGKSAVPQIIDALEAADNSDADVVLLVRGGGSIEDLWNFNEEGVVRKVYSMNKPVISGVGHEVDTTLVDYVADLRAPTPTGAAERATPEIRDVSARIDGIFRSIASSFLNKLSGYVSDVEHLRERLRSRSPSRALQLREQSVKGMYEKIKRNALNFIERREQALIRDEEALKHARAVRDVEIFDERIENTFNNLKNIMFSITEKRMYVLDKLQSELKAYDPNIPLKKGYSLVYKDERLVSSIRNVKKDDLLKIVFADGRVSANVKEVQKSGRNS
ncbi:exodeoxyribonuclease VII large subunit [Mesoaciditoga lauensis]|uniref:exodeoxyribonuclease VII large subunit n=1 Tax=Mesoaciditoga lauensis TaxID=1495039 RepID=UPI00056066BE|nr:exodeoxyribonuclease VII large subunit [Mesoaciditoga lauensis]